MQIISSGDSLDHYYTGYWPVLSLSCKFIPVSPMDMKYDAYLTPHTKIKSGWITDQNVKDKTITFLEGIHNLGVGKTCLKETAKEDC